MSVLHDKTMFGEFTISLCNKIKLIGSPLSDDDLADLRQEFAPPRRYRCSDGMCGAEDCQRCHPEGCREEEEKGKDDRDE